MNGTLAHITPIRGVNDEGQGKKHALHRLIHSTDAEVLWLHDDDIIRPAATDAEAMAQMGEAELLILPLRMCTTQDSLLQRLQVIEYTALQELTIRTARSGHPVLCSGANLIVRRSVWLEAEPHLHPEMPSGDDMYLLEYCKRTQRLIAVGDADRMTATVTAQPTLRALLRQRARWAGKAPYYTDPDIRRMGACVVIAVLLQLICPLAVLVYLPWEYSLVRGRGFALTEVLLLALIYPFYAIVSLISGMLHPDRW